MDEFIEEEIIIPKIEIGTLMLSDGQEIAVSDISEGGTYVNYRRLSGHYTGDCAIELTITDAETAASEITAALEIELVSKTKIDQTPKTIMNALETAIDQHIDQIAKDKGYGRVGVSPSVACLGYASYPNQYQSEAIAYGQWIANIWPIVHQIMADVESGIKHIPTKEELIAEMPVMVWEEV